MDIRVDSIVRGVRPKGHLKSDTAQERLISLLVDRIRSSFAQGLEKLEKDPDLLLLVCRCIRNAGVEKHHFDEVELCLQIMCRLFPDQFDSKRLDEMRALIRCFEDNKCIKKLSMCQRSWHWLFAFQKNDA